MSAPDPAAEASPGLTDIHAHPAMNAWLFDRDLRRHYWSGSVFNPLASLSDFRMLEKGGVRVLWSSLHVPERQYFRCGLIRLAAHFTRGGRRLLRLSPWECLLDMLDTMERQVARAGDRFAVARSNAELDAVVASGKRAIVHTVEGADVIGDRLERLDELAERGVASITLAHLFPSEVAGHVEGIPDEFRGFPICPIDTGVVLSKGLTPFGEEVVERMVRLRMVPDVTHCTGPAREGVLRIVAGRVPVVATHTGVQSLNPVPYNLEPADVAAIAATGGVVGVIFMPYWLDRSHPKPGLDAIWKTMLAIRDAAGSWGAVAIGSDFDGFTDPPDDVQDASRLPRIGELLARKGLAEEEIAAVLGGNARRVLRLGWR